MFSDEVKYQLDFAKKSKVFPFIGHMSYPNFDNSFSELKKLINTSKNIDKISIVSFHETFLKPNRENVIDYMNTIGIEYYLSAATSTSLDNFFNPLVNIFFWRDTLIRRGVKWSTDINLRLFNKNLYETNVKKTNKGILSMRRKCKRRELLDSIIDKDKFDGIYRFINYPYPVYNPTKKVPASELSDEIVSQYPSTFNLIKEYKKSYVSFVVETLVERYLTYDILNAMTEKTLLSFCTKTLPIVLGGKNYVKELKNMGFYVFNDEFGFNGGDILDDMDNLKVHKFNNCINHYNNMSLSDVRDLYNENIDKIEHNYKLVSELLFDKNSII